MDFLNVKDQTISSASRGLEWREKRHSAIAANITNADTPGYKSIDVSFEKAMEKAGLRMATTHASHLGGRSAPGRDSIVLSGGLPRRDGNDVDIDSQMASLARNQIEYSLLTKALAKRFQVFKEAISGRP